MSLHAIDDIGDAIDATKSLFVPVDVRQWLKLAFVVFFIGGGGGGLSNVQTLSNFGNQGGGGGGTGGEFGLTAPLDGLLGSVAGPLDSLVLQTSSPPIPAGGADVLAQYGALLVAAVVGLVLLALLYGLLSNFMEFVFTQALIDREVHVRQYFRQHVGNGIQLLLFRLVLSVVTLLAAAAFAAALFVLVLGGSAANLESGAFFAVFPLALIFIVGISVLVGLVSGFTTVFVVPLMTSQDVGVIGGWRRLLSSMTSNGKQYLAYLFFSVVLAIGVGIVGSIVGVIVFLIVGIPFGLVGFGLWTALGHGTAALVLVGLVATLFVFTVVVLSSMIQAPLQAFLRYYAMLVLGDIDESLDPIPEVRADVRT